MSKKNIGATLALYPCPVIVVGAMANNKPTWTLVAHAGTVAHSHLMVSLVQAHYINQGIRENKKLFGSRMSSAQFTDLSINETFPRTLSTNLCLLMVLTILAVVSAIVRLESMLRFSLPMIIGVLSVAYTSLIFSTTLWVTWSEFRQGLRYNRNSE